MLFEGQQKLKKIVDENFSLLHKNQDTAAYFNSIERALASMDVTILHTSIAQEELLFSQNWNPHTQTPIRTSAMRNPAIKFLPIQWKNYWRT